MKMMVVGGPGRGKTTLLHQLLQEKMTGHPRNNLATLGVNVKQWRWDDTLLYSSDVSYVAIALGVWCS